MYICISTSPFFWHHLLYSFLATLFLVILEQFIFSIRFEIALKTDKEFDGQMRKCSKWEAE